MAKAENSTPSESTKTRNKLLFFLPLALIVVAGIAVGGYFFWKAGEPTTARSQADTKKIVDQIGRLIELPANETPQVATVSDISKLQGQQFFAHAQNGDQLLIYSGSKKAILYRPSTNKIVEVGPINLQPTQSPDASSSASTATSLRVLLLNGTSVTGLTRTAEKDLTGADKRVNVVDRQNASKQDYSKTVVIDVSGKHAEDAKSLAGILKGSVAALPDGETKPTNADIVIILGEDFTQ